MVVTQALSPSVRATVAMLHTISRWVDETPPETTAMRYGNPAFRTFFARLTDEAQSLTAALLPAPHAAAAVELAPYLVRIPVSALVSPLIPHVPASRRAARRESRSVAGYVVYLAVCDTPGLTSLSRQPLLTQDTSSACGLGYAKILQVPLERCMCVYVWGGWVGGKADICPNESTE